MNILSIISGQRMRGRSPGHYITAFLTLVMLSGCVIGLGGRANVNTESQATAARIKAALAREPRLNVAPLNILVVEGVATIDGFVETEFQRERIRAVAGGVKGVTAVRIDIELKQ